MPPRRVALFVGGVVSLPTPYYESRCGRAVLHCANNQDALPFVQAHSVVCDPPAGIGFMGKGWDKDKGGRNQWVGWMQERAALAMDCVPPGGHALVWALPRTSHWTATAWEDAGWEVRDRLSHLFGTGFPKSLNVSKALDKMAGAEREVVGQRQRLGDRQPYPESPAGYKPGYSGDGSVTAPATDLARQWDGWGTALKPGMEDWWLLRKPLAGTVAANVAEHGTGAINVDGCRVPCDEKATGSGNLNQWRAAEGRTDVPVSPGRTGSTEGRWPANVIHDGSEEVMEAFAEYGERSSGKMMPTHTTAGQDRTCYRADAKDGFTTMETYGDTGTAARFFYAAKASKAERGKGNTHPTVKPVDLMRYLCRLVTPPGGTVLDPFAGSGSTGLGALAEGFRFVGIEQSEQYCEIAAARLAHAVRQPSLFS